ncbi:MAG: hypothetical protein QF724_06335 [Planctomycetota bacterium]|jgi:hypothetical protein|nr:hypothetical protein [Planctomycetota bacterium]MDP6369881.1 hypothetical protein [Planctomycetota bacterium]MDP6518663.1 hypothetical protein [Planctomycetota bacterium]MDP6838538.1 hypothetical protein [Planctomycetota bacterium]
MAKRAYNRRTEEQRIAELEAKIEEIKQRKISRERKDSPVIKELPKIRRQLKKFSTIAMEHGRKDLANSAQLFLESLQRQAMEEPAKPKRGRKTAKAEG